MIPALQPPDSLHLQAAEGWVGLGDCPAASRAHPDVLHPSKRAV